LLRRKLLAMTTFLVVTYHWEKNEMNTDLTFITNENNQNLLSRFNSLIKDTRLFDVLVGYFYSSGFYALYKSLENTEKIRILIGITADKNVSDLIQDSKKYDQLLLDFSYSEAKNKFSDLVKNEMDNIEENFQVEKGVYKFLEWLQSGRLEIRVYPSRNIHAKLYVMTFKEGDRDVGRVITGSSNFTKAGLVDNLEFNVELKGRSDYDFAISKFNRLWESAIDVKEKYIETIKKKTWLNDEITPYSLYLKFLYEYFKEKINLDQKDIFKKYLPGNFMSLEYQSEAVKDAIGKLEEYGGVFISDVVGLGKTYVSAMLAQQIDGRCLVLAPPVLLDKYNPGSWVNVFSDFRIPADFESIGKLDRLVSADISKYKNIFIDEAHRFRTETNITYEKLAQICRGKRIILVTATPLNNYPKDILAQIKLFQKSRKSNIPNLPDLETFFSKLQRRLKNLDRQVNYDEYMKIVKDNAKQIRDKVLKYLIVRRTRSEIINYFKDDLNKQNFRFPEVSDPESVFYQLNEVEDSIFNETIELITKKIKYVRYSPMLYYKGKISQVEELAQKNLGKLMKILLIKRLESSFYAFRNTLGRFIKSYEIFLREFENGNVYISKKHINKIFDLLEYGDFIAVQNLIDQDKAERFDAKEFSNNFKIDLKEDLENFKKIKKLWTKIKRDPKLLSLKKILIESEILKNNKLIIFTESKETAEYLKEKLESIYKNQILLFTGGAGRTIRDSVIENFDANAQKKKNKYRILISTEVLSEGVSLHRANVVINYDIPWNPTRLMQRVGRINRIDTKFDTIYTFNFFPTKQSNDQIKLKEAAEAKIHRFIEMLGNDARLLTDGEEIKSFDLFSQLNSKETITGEDGEQESELKYLKIIRNLRDNEPDIFQKIKRLPKKARSAKKTENKSNALLTYFRKGKLQKFFLSDNDDTIELDFLSAAKILEAEKNQKKEHIGKDFYDFFNRNKEKFKRATTEEITNFKQKGGRDTSSKILKILKSKEVKHFKGFTDEDEIYIEKLVRLIEEGGLPKQTSKNVMKKINKIFQNGFNPLKILAVLKTNIADEFFKETYSESSAQTSGPRKVILSEYLVGQASRLPLKGVNMNE